MLQWSHRAGFLLLAVLCLLVGRVAQLKLIPGERLPNVVDMATSQRPEIARRGDIFDRRGRPIATSTVGYRLFVDPHVAKDADAVARTLAAAIDADAARVKRLIEERASSRYVVIDHLLEEWQVDAVRAMDLPGVGLEPRLMRHYPHGELAAALIGKVGFEHSGLAGVEHVFNDGMEPKNGRLTYLRDARQQALWIQPHGYVPAQDGASIQLSIDLIVQDIVERHIRAAVEKYNAGGGRGIVLDCRTGELLAIYDLLNERPGWDEFTHDPMRDVHLALGRNRCVTDPYEPGSTFKPFIWAVATELGKAHPDEVLPIPEGRPYRTSRGRSIREAHYYGPSTWRTVLVKSMNAGMAIVAERLTEREMQEAIARFGFGRRTDCGLPGETVGLVTTPEAWTHYSQTSVSFGQEVAVTPVQMVRAFSAFARDGTLATLSILAKSRDDLDFEIQRRVLREDVVMTAREAMRSVMTEGSGRAAQSDRYDMFGKSGTAQLPRKVNGKFDGYHEDRYVANFIVAAPYDDPRIVVLVVLDDPDRSKGHFGGAIAGPVARDIIDETLAYLGVPPTTRSTSDHS